MSHNINESQPPFLQQMFDIDVDNCSLENFTQLTLCSVDELLYKVLNLTINFFLEFSQEVAEFP